MVAGKKRRPPDVITDRDEVVPMIFESQGVGASVPRAGSTRGTSVGKQVPVPPDQVKLNPIVVSSVEEVGGGSQG